MPVKPGTRHRSSAPATRPSRYLDRRCPGHLPCTSPGSSIRYSSSDSLSPTILGGVLIWSAHPSRHLLGRSYSSSDVLCDLLGAHRSNLSKPSDRGQIASSLSGTAKGVH